MLKTLFLREFILVLMLHLLLRHASAWHVAATASNMV